MQDEKISKFFSSYPARTYNSKHIMLFPGDVPDFVYRIIKGGVKKYLVDNRGDEIIIQLYGPGDLLPLGQVLNLAAEPFIFETEGATQLTVAPANVFRDFLQSEPDTALFLLKRQLHKMQQLSKRVVHFMNGTAKQRVIYELILESRTSMLNDENAHKISLNESQLASRTGLTRETVSRAIKELKIENLVGLQANKIVVRDLLGLEKKLGGFV